MKPIKKMTKFPCLIFVISPIHFPRLKETKVPLSISMANIKSDDINAIGKPTMVIATSVTAMKEATIIMNPSTTLRRLDFRTSPSTAMKIPGANLTRSNPRMR